MKKKFISHDDDVIDLSKLFKIIWHGKTIIIIAIVISFLLGTLYQKRIPDSFVASITLKPKNNSEFVKLDYTLDFINLNKIGLINTNNDATKYKNINILILEKFIEELLDYEELVLVLKNNKKIKERIFNLSEKKQNRQLFQYSNLLKTNKITSKKLDFPVVEYVVTFEWDKSDEAIDILQQIVNLTLKNFEESFLNQLALMLEIKKKKVLDEDNQRLEYLLEQSQIAQELKIEENQIDVINLSKSNNVLFNINSNDIAYYLRGSKAIQKEISLIKNRKYKMFNNINKEIEAFRGSKINWLEFNFNLINVKSVKDLDSRTFLIKSILGGLLVGIIYVILANIFQSQTVSRKKTNKI